MSTICRLPLPLLMLASSAGALAAVPAYEIDPARSTIRISSPESPLAFDASISNLAGNLVLSGDRASPRSLDLVFDLSTLDSGNSSLNEALQGPGNLWVDRGRYGVTLVSDVRASGPAKFRADSTLTLRDSSCTAPVEFTWNIASEAGRSVGYLHGTTQISADEFHLLNGNAWDRVLTVTYDLRLTPATGLIPAVTRRLPDTGLVADDYPPARCTFAPQSAGAFSPESVRARQHP